MCSSDLEAVHERALARTRGAHDGGEAAGLEVHGDAVERPHLAVAASVGLDGVDGTSRRDRSGGGGHDSNSTAYAHGMSLGATCTNCGAELPDGARFCPSCGSPQTPAGAAEERRVVTAVFVDIVGFTSLAERMDPEQVMRFVEHCFERLVEVVTEFGGRVDKTMGDGMLVLFGAPVAHEDDAERAVRAALRMQEVVDDGIRLRIGDRKSTRLNSSH